MKPFLIALLINPFIALVFLTLPVLAALWLWQKMPDGRVKRLLFKSYGQDSGPWARRRITVREVRSSATRK